jgi:hypothetical protein
MTPNEAKGQLCPFGAGFHPPITTCQATACMAWRKGTETEHLPAGMEPQSEGWYKHGPVENAGGAVTTRQQWRRETGWCGHVFNDR